VVLRSREMMASARHWMRGKQETGNRQNGLVLQQVRIVGIVTLTAGKNLYLACRNQPGKVLGSRV